MKNDLTNVKLCIVGCTLFLAGAVWTGLGVGLGVIALVLGIFVVFASFPFENTPRTRTRKTEKKRREKNDPHRRKKI